MKFLILFITIGTLGLNAQDQRLVIEATTDKNVFLFFPSPITRALSGNGQFRFGYNQETAEKFGVLKAVGAEGESTLHVITEDESVYSFIITYKKQLSNFEHFFDGSEAVGNIGNKNKSQTPQNSSGSNAPKIDESHYFDSPVRTNKEYGEFCKLLSNQKPFYKSIFKNDNNIVLRLNNVVYKDNMTFVVLTLENKSPVDYDLNFIQFNKVVKKAHKKSNYQAIEIKPINGLSFQEFGRVNASESRTAIYVFDKLSIDKNKMISIELNELQGERNIKLPIHHNIINNPNHIQQ